MSEGTRRIAGAEARVTRLPETFINRSSEKPNREPAKIIEFQRRTPSSANLEQQARTAQYKAVNEAIAAHHLASEGLQATMRPSEAEVQDILRGLSTALQNLRATGRAEDMLVHNLDPQRVADLLKE